MASLLMHDEYQAPLSREIQREYNKLVNTIAHAPETCYTTKSIHGTGGLVSVADIIAYQIGWGTLLIGWYHAGLRGEMPAMPSEGFSKWDYVGLARHFYTKYQCGSPGKQLQELFAVVKKILDIVEREYQTGNLDIPGVWLWCTLTSGKQWPLGKWIRVNTSSPYKKARRLISQLLTII